MKKLDVLFVVPDYHNSSTLAHSLNKLGIESGIWIPHDYPPELLKECIFNIHEKTSKLYSLHGKIQESSLFAKYMKKVIHVVISLWKWKVFFSANKLLIYGDLVFLNYFPENFLATVYARFKGDIFFVPSGCRFEAPKSWWKEIDNNSICGNCGFESECNNKTSMISIKNAEKYVKGTVGFGFLESPFLVQNHFKYKSFEIPEERKRIKQEKPIKFLHTYSTKSRDLNGKNIKGTDIVRNVFEKLKNEGLKFDYEVRTGIPADQMKYVQKNADVVVDQLHYGWWGSTSLECIAMGIPVICHMKQSFLENFEKNFRIPSDKIPIINTSASNFEQTIRQIIADPSILIEIETKMEMFRKKFLDINNNVFELLTFLGIDLTRRNERLEAFKARVYATPLENYVQKLKSLGFAELDRVIDYGCGYGQWTVALASLNKEVIAVDNDEKKLAEAKNICFNMGINNVKFMTVQELFESDVKSQAFFSYSVSHLMPLSEFFQVIVSTLCKNGKFYFTANSLGWYLHCIQTNRNRSKDYSPRIMGVTAVLRNLFGIRSLSYKKEYHWIHSESRILSEVGKFNLKIQHYGKEGSFSNSSFFVSPYKKIDFVQEYEGTYGD